MEVEMGRASTWVREKLKHTADLGVGARGCAIDVAPGCTTILLGIVVAILGVSTLPLGRWISETPAAVVWVGLALVIAGTFTAGVVVAVAAIRWTRVAALDASAADRRLVQVRSELAELEAAVADRTVEYAEIGDRLREASALLAITEDQMKSFHRMLNAALAGTKRAAWISVLNFLSGIAIGYFINWTSDSFKPPFL